MARANNDNANNIQTKEKKNKNERQTNIQNNSNQNNKGLTKSAKRFEQQYGRTCNQDVWRKFLESNPSEYDFVQDDTDQHDEKSSLSTKLVSALERVERNIHQ